MLLGKGKIYFVVSASKGETILVFPDLPEHWLTHLSDTAKLLQPITSSSSSDKIEVEILTRSKDEAENKKQFEKIIEIIGNGVSLLVLLEIRARI